MCRRISAQSRTALFAVRASTAISHRVFIRRSPKTRPVLSPSIKDSAGPTLLVREGTIRQSEIFLFQVIAAKHRREKLLRPGDLARFDNLVHHGTDDVPKIAGACSLPAADGGRRKHGALQPSPDGDGMPRTRTDARRRLQGIMVRIQRTLSAI